MKQLPTFSPFTLFAREMAQQAGVILAKNFRRGAQAFHLKADKSLITKTDTQIDSLYLQVIRSSYPDHNIHSEESGDESHGSTYTWYLDPLDGTTNFVFGVPFCGTMVALAHKNKLITSVINLPLLDCLFVAESGQGTWANDRRLNLPSPIPLAEVTLVVDCGKTLQAKQQFSKFIDAVYLKARSIRQFGCGGTHLMCALQGNLHFSYLVDAPLHDQLPLALLHQEIGLTLLNRKLEPWSIGDQDLIALHPSLLSKLSTCMPH